MIDPPTSIPQSLGQKIMIVSDGYAFEGMVLRVSERSLCGLQVNCAHVTTGLQSPDFAVLFWRQAVALPLPDFDCRDFYQLFRTAFADQHGNFICRRFSSILPNELLDSFIALPAPLAVF